MLTTEGLRIGQCAVNITDFLIENCPLLKPVKLLSDIIEAQQSQGTNHLLKHIRAVGFEEEYYTADALDMLANLADGTYEGLSAEGLAGEEPIPVLDGKITVYSKYYQDFVDKLRGAFNKLELIMKGEPAVYLADPVWREIAISLWDTDHDGFITAAEASENRLVSFENFDNAAKIEILDLSALYTNITPYIVNLTRIKKVIYGNSKYASSVSANSAKGNTSIEYVDAGDYYTSIDYGAFWKCTSLKIVILNKNITVIDQRGFQDCTSMESCYIKATIPPALGTWAFDNNPCKIYVPHESVATYKAATNWNLYASQIYGYDF